MENTHVDEEAVDQPEAAGGTDHAAPKKPLGYRFWIAFWAVAFTNLAAAYDSTTLSVAIPAISMDLGGSSIQAFWAGTSYLLATTILMLIWVTLSDAFGRRPIIIIALLIFAVGAIVCALAHNWTQMLAGRTVQGLGGGGIIALTTVLVTDMVPLRERPKFFACISAVWAVGSTTGPIIGGVLAQVGAWQWIFWLNLPIIAIAMAGIIPFLRLSSYPRTLAERLALFDYPGSALFIASLTSFLIPVTWGGVQYPWSSWHTLVSLILGAAGLGVFGIYEFLSRSWAGKMPVFIPPNVFRNRSVGILYVGSVFHGLVLYSIVYYMPEYFQTVKNYSPLISGVLGLPQTATIVPCSVAVGVAVGVTGRYRWAVWAGWALTCFGLGLLILLDVRTTVTQWVFLAAVSGLGIGLLFPSVPLAIQSSVPQEDVGMAATLVQFFRSLGQALGVAIGGAIVDNRLRVNLAKAGLSDQPASLIRLIRVLKELPVNAPLAVALRNAMSKSFRTIWIVMCAFSAMNLLLSFLIAEYSMNQEHKTEQRFIHEKDEHLDSNKGSEGISSTRMSDSQ
ncbi:uncharacterized protein GIQ15_03980 [Arthroderma uncinatum]|uniref:uncharacterized protein n=1 Tax=Arthroderma uncinatum TaxID=74035 RepID=UPI00144A8553|nr:uncharacterized protein GIQ15_03980 [Arthroderma uncinatum]KAF3481221.1 hypothetical protein GIQ15_03980 [Arthroderma uncinatum]